MSNFKLFRRGDCPICSGQSKKLGCYRVGDLIGCRESVLEPNRGLEPILENGYTHKLDKLQVFYLYRPKREKREYTDIDRTKFKLEIALKKEQLLQKDKEEISPLTVEERSTESKKLLSSLDLAKEDSEHLEKIRGLTKEVIEVRCFKSFRGSESISSAVSGNLPGVNKHNGITSTNTRGEGFLVPVWNDFNNQILGFQSRDNDPATKAKYKWVRNDKHSPHLLLDGSKELPIAVIRPSQINNYSLNFCEGTLKPIVAAERLKRIFIGASSGLFSNSPRQIEQAIKNYEAFLAPLLVGRNKRETKILRKQFYTKEGKLKVILWVDAGDVINPNVILRLKDQCNFLESLNLSISIVWYGQITKKDHDCDELTEEDLLHIQLVTPSKFFGFAETLKREKYTPDIIFSEPYLPYTEFKERRIYGIRAPLGSGKTVRTIEFFSNNFEDILQNQTTVLFVGTRNSLLEQTIHKLNDSIDGAYGKYFIHINDKDNIDIENNRLLGLCLDSLMKIDLNKIDNLILVLDELVSLWGHLYFSTTHISGRRNEIIDKFWALVDKAKFVICLDANLADWAMQPFIDHANKPVIKINNNFKVNNKYPYQFLVGTEFTEDGPIERYDNRPMVKDIIDNALEVVEVREQIKIAEEEKDTQVVKELRSKLKPFVIPCDSQRFGESLHILLKNLGLKGFILDGKTSGLKGSKNFLKVPDKWIETNQPDYLIYSPSAESGLDVSIKGYFEARYCFFFGVTSVNCVDSLTQMLKRVRADIPTKIWVREMSVSASNNHRIFNSLAQLKAVIDAEFQLKVSAVLKDESLSNEVKMKLWAEYEESKDSNYNFALDIYYHGNIEQKSLRASLLNRLKEMGVNYIVYVDSLDPHSAVPSQFRVAKEQRDVIDAENVFKSCEPIIIDGKYQTSLNESAQGFWASKKKASIYNRFPGIKDSSLWSPELINLICNQQPQLPKQLTLETKVRNYDLAVAAATPKYKRLQNKESKDLLPFLNEDLGLVTALHSISLVELVDSSKPFFIDDELPQQIIKSCRTWNNRKFLGSQGTKTDPNWLKYLLGLMGYSLESKRVRIEGTDKRPYQYTISRVPILSKLDPSSVCQTITDCLTYKIQKQAKKATELEWNLESVPPRNEVLPPILKSVEVFFPEVPETLTEHGLESVPNEPKSLNDIESNWDKVTAISYQSESVEAVSIPIPPIDPVVEEVKEIITWVTEDDRATFNEVIKDFGSTAVTAAIDKLEDDQQRATLTDWLKCFKRKVWEGLQLIDHTTRDRENFRTFEWLLKDFGSRTLSAAINKIKDLNKRLTFTQWIRELETGLRLGSKIIYLGVEHVLKRFIGTNEAVLRINSQEFTVSLQHLKPVI